MRRRYVVRVNARSGLCGLERRAMDDEARAAQIVRMNKLADKHRMPRVSIADTADQYMHGCFAILLAEMESTAREIRDYIFSRSLG